jgi:RNA polymerase sigma factor (sigma-70 family)
LLLDIKQVKVSNSYFRFNNFLLLWPMDEEKQGDNTCDEMVFKKLFQAHSKDLYRFLYHKYGSGNNPQDLVQEAFIKLWDNCGKVAPDKARGFLFTVANNQMLNELAKQKTVVRHQQEAPQLQNNESPEYIQEEKEYKAVLEQAIAGLTEEQRTTFLLNRMEGKTHQEIADMLGISRKGVEKRIYTALAILYEKVGKF